MHNNLSVALMAEIHRLLNKNYFKLTFSSALDKLRWIFEDYIFLIRSGVNWFIFTDV